MDRTSRNPAHNISSTSDLPKGRTPVSHHAASTLQQQKLSRARESNILYAASSYFQALDSKRKKKSESKKTISTSILQDTCITPTQTKGLKNHHSSVEVFEIVIGTTAPRPSNHPIYPSMFRPCKTPRLIIRH